MALDFKLKLIMPDDSAAIFCRSSLEATRYLIKKKAPRLATQLSEILAGEPLPLDEEEIETIYQQSFYVDFEPDLVCEIAEILIQVSLNESNSPTPGLVVLAKSLHKDWSELAHSKGLINK
jgi:hypothetical protein